MPSYFSVATRARASISLRIWFAAYRSYKRIYHPFVDLGIRLSVTQFFLHSAMVQAMTWHDALYLAGDKYSVSWLSPQHAGLLRAGIELICPILFALGLFTRAAAIPMAILTLVAHTSSQTHDANLFLGATLIGYVMFGARAISIDGLITPGLSDSAVPIFPNIIYATERFTKHVGPAFQLTLRLWLGWTLLRLPASTAIFPVTTAHHLLPPPVTILGGLMLALGFGVPVANKALLAMVGVQMMMSDSDGFWMILILAQIGMLGAGRWSFDDRIYAMLVDWMKPSHGTGNTDSWPRVVIVGAGFGGIACAAKLRHLPAHLTLIDRHNHHLFQPLLYQVATAGLSPADIASPIRSQFRDDPNVRVVMKTVTGIDVKRQTVHMGDDVLPFDSLVLATGASHSYFGRDEWSRLAPGLKRINDATAIRAKLLSAFENAENEPDSAERDAWLTFVIVGGGPTGVELAGAIAELAHFGLQEEFRRINPASAQIFLVQSGPRILPAFQDSLSARAQRSLERLGVTVRINSRVQEIDVEGVTVNGQRLRAKTVLWAAGVVASPAARWLGVEPDHAGRTPVDAHLRLPNHDNIFVIGDAAAASGWHGGSIPGLAPAAQQGGRYVARMIRARLEARGEPAPFVYHHKGSLATIGRKAAVADFGRVRLWGAPAWWLWGLVHVLFLATMRNRVSVIIAWIWAYLTFRSGTRLITEQDMPEDA